MFRATLRYTSAYVKRDEQWRMLGLQMQRRTPDQRGIADVLVAAECRLGDPAPSPPALHFP